MTQEERTQVWARKDQLFRALAQIPVADRELRNQVLAQIETCNQALIQNKYELMPQRDEPTTV
jgi:glycerol-3-phosphate cytidylyltransferase-like family protein